MLLLSPGGTHLSHQAMVVSAEKPKKIHVLETDIGGEQGL